MRSVSASAAKPARILKFDSILKDATNGTWHSPGYVVLDTRGRVVSILDQKPGTAKVGKKIKIENVAGIAIPGMVNSHSHAFQYAMAGLTERLTPSQPHDTFWTWRQRMYKLATSLKPEEIQIIATAAYAEMLKHGFTSVVEFHYLHHNQDGTPYRNRAELSECMVRAAETAGIDLTLAPVFYGRGDFTKEIASEQRRFHSKSPDEYLKIWQGAQKSCEAHDFRLATCVHSLRAAAPDHIKTIFKMGSPQNPRHMHIAEQELEVQGAVKELGLRPIEWMLQNFDVDSTFHFTHATHISESEALALSRSKAGVILCPSTEGNLGDGFFPLEEYLKHGGRFAIGTDSHVGLSPFEELRWLEYGQRLQKQKRNILLLGPDTDSGSLLYREALSAGRASAGLQTEGFAVGGYFDAMVIDSKHHQMTGLALKNVLSMLIFGSGSSCILGTVVRGKWVVKNGKHVRHDSVFQAYRKIAPRIRGSV